MNTKITCFILVIILSGMRFYVSAQVAINSDSSAPDNSAMLDIKSDSKGLLVPRMTTVQRTGISNPAEGLLVFDTDMGAFYYLHTDSWTILLSASGSWSLAGNNLTGNELFGSTNSQSIKIYSNNHERIRITETGKVGIGLTAPQWLLDVAGSMNLAQDSSYRIQGYSVVSTRGPGNTLIGKDAGTLNSGAYLTAIGTGTLYSNTSGISNTASGFNALYKNTTGSTNTANGLNALYTNTTGSANIGNGVDALFFNNTGNYNTATGTYALFLSTTGDNNTADGYKALYSNHTGNNNTAVGYLADVASGGLTNSTAIGYHAVAASNDEMRLGNDTVSSLYCMGAYTATVTDASNLYVNASGQIMRSTAMTGTFTSTSTTYPVHIVDAQYSGSGNGLIEAVYAKAAPSDNVGYGGDFEGGYLGVVGRVNPTGSQTIYRGVVGTVNGGTGNNYGVWGEATGGNGIAGVHGEATTTSGTCYGVEGYASGSGTNYAVYGSAWDGSTNWAGYFNGDVNIVGTITKGGGTFKIDHPLDPENKYLCHSFVESPDMKNIYDGIVVLDGNGTATVELPAYFDTLNKDFRYQLTCIGVYAQVFIKEEITKNHFVIAGGQAGMKVSWQITGTRKDAFAEQNRIPVEVDKPAGERGKYLYPAAYGLPQNKGINWDKRQMSNRAAGMQN